MNTVLKNLGLTDNEIKIYLGFHNSPNKSAAQIARLIKLDKSSTYKAVEELLSKGLVLRSGYNKGTLYKASSPSVLKDIYHSKQIELKNQSHILDSFIEQLKSNTTETRSTYISIDKGAEGLLLRMNEALESKEKLIRENFNTHPIFRDPEYVKEVQRHAKERIKRGIHIRELQSKEDRESGMVTYGDIMIKLKKSLKEQRDLPSNYKDRNSFRIWDDTAIILSADDTGEFIVLTIRDKYLVTLLKSLFDFLWANSIPVVSE